MKLLRSYYLLCKPNVVYMMLICALVGMLLAEETIGSVSTILIGPEILSKYSKILEKDFR